MNRNLVAFFFKKNILIKTIVDIEESWVLWFCSTIRNWFLIEDIWRSYVVRLLWEEFVVFLGIDWGMSFYSYVISIVFWIGFLSQILASGGNCWVGMSRPGRCTSLLSQHVDKESCCSDAKGGGSAPAGAGAAWSPEDLDAGGLFFWRVLGGGAPCTPCKGNANVASQRVASVATFPDKLKRS